MAISVIKNGKVVTFGPPATVRTVESELASALCEFGGCGEDCEDCLHPIPPGDPVYFFSDGGYEPRDGTYTCKACATKMIKSSFGIETE